jgi:hypothetical protein
MDLESRDSSASGEELRQREIQEIQSQVLTHLMDIHKLLAAAPGGFPDKDKIRRYLNIVINCLHKSSGRA